MKHFFTAKRICRAGIIAALYVALTCAFGAIGYQGFLEIRPAEALCILPLFYAEAIPALYVGCMLSNVISLYGVYDIFLGSLATLIAACLTFAAGKLLRNHAARVAVGGIFPVLVNAFLVPVIIVILYGQSNGYATAAIAYWTYFASMIVTQTLWVYALGIPLYYFVYRMRKKGVSAFLDGKKTPVQSPPEQQ
ncbi:MAG: QueT transporter family protein [Clostridia bacterium]|jgi:uncharacterized membrane protein|nr:QueT transporter family protein [Clostridia bacterium]